MNDDDIELDELFATARELRAPPGAEARGWARFESALGGAGLPGEVAATKLAWLTPAAKVGGVVTAVLALGVVLSRSIDPPPVKRARDTAGATERAGDSERSAPRQPSIAAPLDAAPIASSLPPALPDPSQAIARPTAAAPRSVAPRSAPRPVVAEPSEPAAATVPPPAPEVVVVQRPTAAPASAVTPTDSLRLEAELLGRAWVAIREGRDEDTRALLAEHARRFPRGALAPEREACQLVARCREGGSDAIARARRYLDQHRASHLAARVADGCDLPLVRDPAKIE